MTRCRSKYYRLILLRYLAIAPMYRIFTQPKSRDIKYWVYGGKSTRETLILEIFNIEIKHMHIFNLTITWELKIKSF